MKSRSDSIAGVAAVSVISKVSSDGSAPLAASDAATLSVRVRSLIVAAEMLALTWRPAAISSSAPETTQWSRLRASPNRSAVGTNSPAEIRRPLTGSIIRTSNSSAQASPDAMSMIGCE